MSDTPAGIKAPQLSEAEKQSEIAKRETIVMGFVLWLETYSHTLSATYLR